MATDFSGGRISLLSLVKDHEPFLPHALVWVLFSQNALRYSPFPGFVAVSGLLAVHICIQTAPEFT